MRAVVLKAAGAFGVETVEDPRPTAGDHLLRVKACALCGTDIRVLEGTKTKGVRYPSIIGHEFAGIVEGVGHEVTGFSPGDRVSVPPSSPATPAGPAWRAARTPARTGAGSDTNTTAGLPSLCASPTGPSSMAMWCGSQQGSAVTRRLLPNRCPAASTACGKLRWVSGTRPNCEYQFGVWAGGFGWTDGLRGEQRRPGGHDPGLGRGTGIGGDPG